MMNLFSSFNPITSNKYSMNWMTLMIPIIILSTKYWYMSSKINYINIMFTNSMINQYKSSMNKMDLPNLSMVTTIVTMIFMMNLTSLLPNVFPATSHIMLNLSLSMTMWMSTMIKKMINLLTMMSNLTPSNTPTILIPFMVMIELISMMIQPLTLAIRLTANLTAGHIMMILISQMYYISYVPALMMNMMMMMLELGVSLIQAYVFSMLIIMYNK